MFQNNLRHNGSRKVAQGSSKASLRAKSFVFDRKEVFIGSLNLDIREIVYNTEIGVVLSSAGFARRMGEWFDQNIDRVAFRLELQKDKELRLGTICKIASVYGSEM